MLSLQSFTFVTHRPDAVSQLDRVHWSWTVPQVMATKLQTPVAGVHESTVHLLLSLQTLGVKTHLPVVESQDGMTQLSAEVQTWVKLVQLLVMLLQKVVTQRSVLSVQGGTQVLLQYGIETLTQPLLPGGHVL
jgi:hypothetical protein